MDVVVGGVPSSILNQRKPDLKSHSQAESIDWDLHSEIHHDTITSKTGHGKLTVYTYNAAGMGNEAVADLLSMLSLGCNAKWDVVLVQEGPGEENNISLELDGGHLWFVAARRDRPRSVAILLHRRWVTAKAKPAFITTSGRCASMDIEIEMEGEQYRFISSHLPHS